MSASQSIPMSTTAKKANKTAKKGRGGKKKQKAPTQPTRLRVDSQRGFYINPARCMYYR